VVLDDAVQLASDVLARRTNRGQDPRNDDVLEIPVNHIWETPKAVHRLRDAEPF
jgi:hypothetical protein